MALIHDVIDSDVRFRIDPVTRNISNQGSGKLILIQGDHNSERFSFEIPRTVEGHDMSLCNVVRIHYINTNSKTRETSVDIYEPNDLCVNEADPNVVHFSWLISGNATVYAGNLAFAIEFQCTVGDKVEYSWHTAPNNTISISNGINNAEDVVEDYSDILTEWWLRIYANSTLPIEIHSIESFAALGGETKENTLYMLEDDPTIGELLRLEDPLQMLEIIGKDISSIKTKLDELRIHGTAIVAIQNNLKTLSDRITALENSRPVEPDEPDVPDVPDVPVDPDIPDVPVDPDEPEHTHAYTEEVKVVAATCDAHGYTMYKCSCGLIENRNYTNPLGHSYNHTVTDPTCTEQGYTAHVCTRCGHTYKDTYTPAAGHTWEYYQDPRSGETGWSRRCTVCGFVETDVEYGCLFGGDHTWVEDGIIRATCTTPGYQKYKCSVCGETKQEANAVPLSPTREHDWGEAIYDVAGCFEPTCYEHGHAAYVCKRCGEEKQENVPVLQHSFTDVVVPPTCTEQGYTLKKCTRDGCDYSFVVNGSYVAATGHTWSDPIEYGNGYARECTKCGAIMNITQANCDHSSEEVIDVVVATCTTGGFTKYLCTMCNREDIRDHVAAYGHDYVSKVTEPTCEARGYTTHTCSRCGDSYVDSYVDAGAHSWSGWTTTLEPTCVDDGRKERSCSACGKTETNTIEPLGHDTTYYPGKAPTCTESGYTGYNVCSRCGHSDKLWLDPLGHDYIITPEVPATCTDYGTEELVTCSRCDYSSGGESIEPNGHNFFHGWFEIKAPTCTETGTEKCECLECGHSEERDIPALEHDWEYYPDPTVSSGTSRRCRVCETVEEDVTA